MKLQEFRKNKGMMCKELASELETSVVYLSRILAERVEPSLKLAFKIQDFTESQVTVKELCPSRNVKPELCPLCAKLMKRYESINA